MSKYVYLFTLTSHIMFFHNNAKKIKNNKIIKKDNVMFFRQKVYV